MIFVTKSIGSSSCSNFIILEFYHQIPAAMFRNIRTVYIWLGLSGPCTFISGTKATIKLMLSSAFFFVIIFLGIPVVD